MEVLSELIPPNIIFNRTPVSARPAPQRHSPSVPPPSAILLDTQGEIPQTGQKNSIYGSVTVADIAASIKAILAKNDEGTRVNISPEDINFVEDQREKDRVKQIGVFEIAIKIKGAINEIRRTIEVNATE